MASFETPATVVVWEVKGADGWQAYAHEHVNELEAAHLDGKKVVHLNTSAFEYTVDVINMKQKNVSSWKKRQVRRRTVPVPVYTWEVDTDEGWTELSPTAQALVDEARAADMPIVTIATLKWVYTIDLGAMLQINTVTNTSRPIRKKDRSTGEPGGSISGFPKKIHAATCTERVTSAGKEILEYNAGDGSIDFEAVTKCKKLTPETDYNPRDMCPITMDDLGDDVVQLPCHTEKIPCIFRKDVISRVFETKPICPNCGHMYNLPGPQPTGNMQITLQSTHCHGFPSVGTWVIDYNFKKGIQGKRDPEPNTPYSGTSRRVYIPDTEEGKHAVQLLKLAFKQGQLFIVSKSITTGKDNTVVWSSIHQKTSLRGGPEHHGWPDDGAFERLRAECAAKGIFLDAPGDSGTGPGTQAAEVET